MLDRKLEEEKTNTSHGGKVILIGMSACSSRTEGEHQQKLVETNYDTKSAEKKPVRMSKRWKCMTYVTMADTTDGGNDFCSYRS